MIILSISRCSRSVFPKSALTLQGASTQFGTNGEQLIEDDEVAVDDAGEDWDGTEVGEDSTDSGEEHTKFGVEAVESVKVQQLKFESIKY